MCLNLERKMHTTPNLIQFPIMHRNFIPLKKASRARGARLRFAPRQIMARADRPDWAHQEALETLDARFAYLLRGVDQPDEFIPDYKTLAPSAQKASICRRTKIALCRIVESYGLPDEEKQDFLHSPSSKLGNVTPFDYAVCPITLRYALAYFLLPYLTAPDAADPCLADDDQGYDEDEDGFWFCE